jgi:hypothetical protein
MAVTSWTDNDSNGVPMDWTNPNLADWRYVDALVQAVNERRSALGQNLLIFPDYPGRYINISILQQIHAAVIALIPQYVNHEDSSGDWTGKASIPLWSFNSIMESIAGNVYQLNSGLSVKSDTIKLWAILTYKILNKFRWFIFVPFGYPGIVYQRDGNSHAEVLASEFIGGGSGSNAQVEIYNQPEGSNYVYQRQIRMKLNVKNSFTVNVDIYCIIFANPESFATDNGWTVSINYGFGNIDKIYNRVSSFQTISNMDEMRFFVDSFYTVFPLYSYATMTARFECVLMKFDTAGGFKFKDW